MSQSLVIVPTYNERENLPGLVEKLLALAAPVELLVVDDNSPDGTGRLADELAAQHSTVHVLHGSEKSGLGRAYCAGFAWALARDYEFILEMDGDFSHNPEDVPRLIEAAQQADLALGSRYLPGGRVIDWPMRRLLLSKAASYYVRLITGMPFTDPTGGFKCFRRSTIEAFDLAAVHSTGYGFQIELTHKTWRQGRRVIEIPIVFTERLHNRSKMSAGIVVEAIFTVWRLWLQNGCRRHPRPTRS